MKTLHLIRRACDVSKLGGRYIKPPHDLSGGRAGSQHSCGDFLPTDTHRPSGAFMPGGNFSKFGSGI